MRLPLILDVDSRDGTSDKDSRYTNVLSESDEGVSLAVIRPGLVAASSNSGNGNGITEFHGTLISSFGTTLGTGETPSSIGTVANGVMDFAESPL